MKNRVKGLLALCLAMCMVLTMTTVAFGADPRTIYYGDISESGETMQAGDKITTVKENCSGISFFVVKEDGYYWADMNTDTNGAHGTAYATSDTISGGAKKYFDCNHTVNKEGETALAPDTFTLPEKTGYHYKAIKTTATTPIYLNMGSSSYELNTALKLTVEENSSYTVTFELDGGNFATTSPNKTGNVKWTDKVLEGVTAPTKDGHKFVGWNYVDKEGTSNTTQVTADTTYANLAKSDSVKSITLTAVWEVIPDDETPTTPTPTHQHTRRQSATTTVETPTTTVASPKTFDAGVAVYGVMAALSLTGTAAIIGKKRKF